MPKLKCPKESGLLVDQWQQLVALRALHGWEGEADAGLLGGLQGLQVEGGSFSQRRPTKPWMVGSLGGHHG